MKVKEAAMYIQQYRDAGDLLDLYSVKFSDSELGSNMFAPGDLEEFQKKSNNKCEGHLHVLYVDQYTKEIPEVLQALYSPFKLVYKNEFSHKPDFIFFNLNTKQIFCIGLARKNQCFLCELRSSEIIYYSTAVSLDIVLRGYEPCRDAEPREVDTKQALDKFTQYDFCGHFGNVFEALDGFGSAAYQFDRQPLTPDEIDEILSKPPSGDGGLYEVDDELLTREEVEYIAAEYQDAQLRADDCLCTIQSYFPSVDWSCLTTQDY